MKKLLMVALVLGLVLSLAQVTVADDRLKLDGSLRVRAYNVDNADNTSDVKDRQTYYDSRLRFGFKLTVAEGISANFRTDFEDDGKWGLASDQGGFGRPTEGKQMNTDRAYIRIEKDMFILDAGHIAQYFGQPGYFTAYGPQERGFGLRLKLPVMIDLNYFKLSEDGNVVDDAGPGNTTKDLDMYAIQAQYKTDMFQVGGYYATIIDGTDLDRAPNDIGLWGNVKVGPAIVRGALDFFGGTQSTDVDVMGTQLFLNGEMKVTNAATFGLDAYYALARNPDNNEVQYNQMGETGPLGNYGRRFGGFEPMEKGIQWLTDAFDYLGTGDQPFDLNNGCGSMGADLYGLFTPAEKVKIAAQLGYFMPQDDDHAITYLNSITLAEASVNYTFAPKCDVIGAAFYRSVDVDEVSTDATVGFIGALQIQW